MGEEGEYEGEKQKQRETEKKGGDSRISMHVVDLKLLPPGSGRSLKGDIGLTDKSSGC